MSGEMNLGSLVVDLVANIADFDKATEDAKTKLEAFGKKLEPAVAATGIAFVGLAGSIAFAVNEFSQAQQAELRLATALKATGQAVDLAPFRDLAGVLQSTTQFSDETVMSSAAMLAKLGLVQDQITMLLPGMADYAALMGSDLPEAANVLGRAIVTGTVGPMTRAGIAFDDAAKAAFENATVSERVAIVMAKLQGSAGGAATAMGGTFAGAVSQLGNAFSDVAETVGSIFEPTVTSAIQSINEALREFNTWLSELSPGIKGLIAVAAGLALTFLGLVTAWGGAVLLLPKLLTLLGSLKTLMIAIGIEAALATVAIAALAAAGIALGDMAKASGGTFEGFLSDLPLIFKGAALTLLDAFDEVFGLLPGSAEAALRKVGDKIVGWAAGAGEWFGGIVNWAASALSKIGDWIASLFPDAWATAVGGATGALGSFFADAKKQIEGFIDGLVSALSKVADMGNAIGKAIADPFITAFKYWSGKVGGIAAPTPAAAGGGSPSSAPAAGSTAATVQTQAQGLAADLQKLAASVNAANNETTTLKPLLQQWNAAMKGGLTAEEAQAFSKSLTASGVSLDQFKGFADKAREAYAQAVQATLDFGRSLGETTTVQDKAAGLVEGFRTSLEGGMSKGEAAAFNQQLAGAGLTLEQFKGVIANVSAVESAMASAKLQATNGEITQLAYFADTLRGFQEFGATAQDMNALAEAAKKAGVGLDQIATAAASAAKADRVNGWFSDFRALAEEATASWLEQFDGVMASTSQGLGGALATVYNEAVEVFGGNLVEGAITAAGHFAEFVSQGAQMIAAKLLPSMGAFGQVVQAGIEGFKSGGIFGAIIAVIVQLISRLSAFKGIVGMLNQFLDFVLKALNPFLNALVPLIKSVLMLVQVVLSVINAISLSTSVAKLLGYIFKGLAMAIGAVMSVIAWVVNYILELVAWVFDAFGMEGTARNVRSSKIDLNAMSEGYDASFEEAVNQAAAGADEGLGDLNDTAGDLGDTLGDFSNAATEATESLTNVPQGFKIAAARFEAAMPDAGSLPTNAGGVGGTTSIGNVYIQSNDPEKIWGSIKQIISWENFSNGGTPIASGTPFSVPAT